MLPKSQYHTPLVRIPDKRLCLLVDNDDDQVEDYIALIQQINTYSQLTHVPQEQAAEQVRKYNYSAIVVDNDGFRIGEYPGLSSVKELIKAVSPERIVYVTSWPNTSDLQQNLERIGVKFCNKGKWRELEEFMRGHLNSEDKPSLEERALNQTL